MKKSKPEKVQKKTLLQKKSAGAPKRVKRAGGKRASSGLQNGRAPKQKNIITKIKVVGIGGAGGSIIGRMMEGDRMRGVEFIAINTDAQDLDRVSAHKKIYIGRALTKGLGAGMNPEIGKQAAEENRSEIGEMLEGADVVFVTAGMGGGTGTLGSSVVAEVAKEKGILTVALVTKPFSFEGSQRATIAQDGLSRLKEKVDALISIQNDRIFTIIDKDTPLLKAFNCIDDVLKQAVSAIAELINVPGIINIDFADIKTILRDAGTTLIGIGFASGPERSMKAVNNAIHSPILDVSIDGARGILFSIAGGRDLKMSEVNDIAKAVTSNLDPGARVIFGAYHDRGMKDKNIKVTVIATGFNGIMTAPRINAPTLFFSEESKTIVMEEESTEEEDEILGKVKPKQDREKKEGKDEQEPWEIPAFLRKKKR